ncbi:hypothetical protein DESAMIL20_938 [Desulfurella amilsii]|uniref:Uncharacterized protein n=1 Tax=Desulfurella amilsii TaxID=1562698 RepID=A0A1X4XV28_9BACT|nr:hypothetical protein DESAMIL20_938 [Desulfurella amilsii]
MVVFTFFFKGKTPNIPDFLGHQKVQLTALALHHTKDLKNTNYN